MASISTVAYGRTIACGKALLRTARELEIPVIVTEQYPEKLGNTVPELAAELDPALSRTVAKSSFGMGQQPEGGRGSVVLWGWEAHVCVQQTVLELVEAGGSLRKSAEVRRKLAKATQKMAKPA